MFAHDTDRALNDAVTLVNTSPSRGDGEQLPTVGSLAAYLHAGGWTGRHDATRAELAEVHAVRERLSRLWELPQDELIEEVNALLEEGEATPRLVRHDDWGWHLHATTADAPLATRIAVEVAMAFVELVRTDELSRLAHCAGEDCSAILVDLSRNRSRRYCERGCGNRAHVAAYRARQATGS